MLPYSRRHHRQRSFIHSIHSLYPILTPDRECESWRRHMNTTKGQFETTTLYMPRLIGTWLRGYVALHHL